MKTRSEKQKLKPIKGRVLNARPDTIDFRDQMFESTLYEVPSTIPLENYLKAGIPILNQGKEGACTGFGLATVIHYLLKSRKNSYFTDQISPRMLYEMAKKYDEWAGEDYVGSSARGAIKGWHKHGVCLDKLWPYDPEKPDKNLDAARAENAAGYPLGAYYRVNHKDFCSMHNALAEVGILYATGRVHDGWFSVDNKSGDIPYEGQEIRGGHAFAIVGYDKNGFWIQNSWGETWGKGGFGRISYDDWAANSTDVWVSRLGAPVLLKSPNSIAKTFSVAASSTDLLPFKELRSHIVSLGNNGALRTTGTYGNNKDDVKRIFTEYIPTITTGWKKVRIAFYAHGGLVSEDGVLQVLSDYRQTLLTKEIYPIFFVWNSDILSTIQSLLEDAFKLRQPEERISSVFDFMLDRIDDMLEPLAREPGKIAWAEMKENARAASDPQFGGAYFTLECLNDYLKAGKDISIHLIGHSAGSILLAPLISKITEEFKLKIKSCTLWAPACLTKDFIQSYVPAIKDNTMEKVALFTLSDRAEQDDNCGRIYNKSLLYLVSNAFEETPRGTSILGMAKFIQSTPKLTQLINEKRIDWITSPNTNPLPNYSDARHHGDFDNDMPCFNSTVERILLADPVSASVYSVKKKSTKKSDVRDGDSDLRVSVVYPLDEGGEAGHLSGDPSQNGQELLIAPSPDAPQMKGRMSRAELKEKREEINFQFKL
ncbi:C1 family peptidase [Pedobacter sp. PLR]|uniref:C1 family peptidase n=1 Tax=Pedobacter sp. PLR TaxID=2994465 RepID=UPI0022479C66|nr:C1 family peptidase [Pedobacter sp. PLR]MCX2454353.1 C1 family peptidase [Pedobacter sp. PLR]